MNYPNDQYQKLKKYLPIVCKHYGITKEVIDSTSITSLLHALHFRVYVNTNYPIDNANVIRREDGITRLIPIDDSFLLYPAKCYDDHIETAMKKAIKELLNDDIL